jgi:hypothetical protein
MAPGPGPVAGLALIFALGTALPASAQMLTCEA